MKNYPSWDEWLEEAKASPDAARIGMYLSHTGVVREDARAKVREGATNTASVVGMLFSYDENRVNAAIESAKQLPGIYYIRVWLNEGRLALGDEIMRVLIGGDTRMHTVDALNYLVGLIKSECVTEEELC